MGSAQSTRSLEHDKTGSCTLPAKHDFDIRAIQRRAPKLPSNAQQSGKNKRYTLKEAMPVSGLPSAFVAAFVVNFTPRQISIMFNTYTGMSNAQISQKEGITIGTVKNYLHNIYNISGMDRRAELIMFISARLSWHTKVSMAADAAKIKLRIEERLSENQRKIIKYAAQGLNNESLSGILGISLNATKQRMFDGLRKIGISRARLVMLENSIHESEPRT